MLALLLSVISFNAFAEPCEPHQMYVRKQWIKSYHKNDGSEVGAHFRQAHCRDLERQDYFRDKPKQKIMGFSTTFRPWSEFEKKIVEEKLSKLPKWLKKYTLDQVLRGDVGGHILNPAATVPLTKTLLIFDQFFKSKNQKEILIHEVSHIAFFDFSTDDLKNFAQASGWVIVSREIRIPPKTLLMPDSDQSISEDFANHIESYYKNKNKLMLFNPLSYLIIDQLIKSKEANP